MYLVLFSVPNEQTALKKLYSKRLRAIVKETGRRCDGRKTDEVKPRLCSANGWFSFSSSVAVTIA